MDQQELFYYFAFSRTGKIGPVTFGQLVDHFGSVEEAWQASASVLRSLGVRENILGAMESVKKEVDLEAELQELLERGVSLLVKDDVRYPDSLRQTEGAPFLIYVLGEIKPQDEKAIAIVGARKISRYGEAVIEQFVPDLVRQGFTIVSGLALGNDSAAHKAALDSKGRTIGVLGSGIQNIYPVRSRSLVETIITTGSGAVITEFPPKMQPFPYNFPIRNRIISGLSQAVIIIEAEEKSGTLLTASHAVEQGKEVLAVPGDINRSLSRGPHKLIRMGARLIQSVDDIFEELKVDTDIQLAENTILVPSSSEEEQIIEVLKRGSLHIDELSRQVDIPQSTTFATVSMMELKGMVVDDGGGIYRLRR